MRNRPSLALALFSALRDAQDRTRMRLYPTRGIRGLRQPADHAEGVDMYKRQLRMLTLDAARAVLVARCNDSNVRREIAGMLSGLDHGLSDEQVLEQLKALRKGHQSSKRPLSPRPSQNRTRRHSPRRLLSFFTRSASPKSSVGGGVAFEDTNHKPDQDSMILCYSDPPIYIGAFNYRLGAVKWDLETLQGKGLLSGSFKPLREFGYHYCYGLGQDETLLSLARVPLSLTLRNVKPRALIAQHCQSESAVLPRESDDNTIAGRNRYFTAALMRELQVDDVPYFCSFTSGCAGFVSLLTVAGGLLSSADERPAVCFMADSRPDGAPFDMQQERILGSDHSSAFLVSSQPQNYQLLGINYYSTARLVVPLVEVVQRTVRMIQQLADRLNLNLAERDVVAHYPNIFPETWEMVTRHLRLPRIEPILDDMAERAHCGATDSVISLAKLHRNKSDRLHIVMNYGIGLHLAVCILKEQSIEGN